MWDMYAGYNDHLLLGDEVIDKVNFNLQHDQVGWLIVCVLYLGWHWLLGSAS